MRTESWESREEGRRLICYLLHGPIARRAKTKSNLWGDVAASSSSSSFFYFSGCIFLSFSFLPTTHTHTLSPLLSWAVSWEREGRRTRLISSPLFHLLCSAVSARLSLSLRCSYRVFIFEPYKANLWHTFSFFFFFFYSQFIIIIIIPRRKKEGKKERKSVEFLEIILIAMAAAAADRQS